MAISSRPWTGRAVSLIDVDQRPSKHRTCSSIPHTTQKHTCAHPQRGMATVSLPLSSPAFVKAEPLPPQDLVLALWSSLRLPSLYCLCAYREIRERLSENKSRASCDVTSLTWSRDCYINQQQRLKYSQWWLLARTRALREAAFPATLNGYPNLSCPNVFLLLFIFPAQKRAFLPCGEKRRAPALEPGLILSLLISLVARCRLTACAAGETCTHVSWLRRLAVKTTWIPTLGGILPVQITPSDSSEWHCEASVLACLSVGYRKLIRMNTAAELQLDWLKLSGL